MYCPNCGKQIPNGSRFCMNCGYKLELAEPYGDNNATSQVTPQTYNYSGPAYQKKKGGCLKAFIIVLAVILVVGIIGIIRDSDNETNYESKVPQDSTEAKYDQDSMQAEPDNHGMTKKEYKKACEEYSYRDIARDPEKYKGKLAKFTGEVIQVQEMSLFGNTICYYRVNITKDTYGYTDTIYVEYSPEEGESRILEDDIITIWGELDGLESYTSVLGQEITIPRLNAKYVKIRNE